MGNAAIGPVSAMKGGRGGGGGGGQCGGNRSMHVTPD